MRALGEVRVVARPGHVEAPGAPLLEAEPRLAGDHERGRLQPRATAAAVAAHRAHGERVPLGGALAQVAAGEVQQFAGTQRDAQGRGEAVEGEWVVAGVGEFGAQLDHALGGEADGEREVEARVRGVERGPVVVRVDARDGEGVRGRPAGAVPGQARGAEPAARFLGHQGALDEAFGLVGDELGREHVGEVVVGGEHRAPVRDDGEMVVA